MRGGERDAPCHAMPSRRSASLVQTGPPLPSGPARRVCLNGEGGYSQVPDRERAHRRCPRQTRIAQPAGGTALVDMLCTAAVSYLSIMPTIAVTVFSTPPPGKLKLCAAFLAAPAAWTDSVLVAHKTEKPCPVRSGKYTQYGAIHQTIRAGCPSWVHVPEHVSRAVQR